MAGGRDWYAPVCSLGAAGQLGSASAWSSRIRASAKAVSALALYTTERCIQSTALRRSLAGGSGACCANPGARDASRKTRVRAVISRPPREPLPVAAIIVLLQSRCALQAVAALGPRGPRRDCESRALSRAQRAQARLQVLVATHDSTPALADEELDLEVDRGPLVVGAQPEVSPVADDQLPARERVADLGRGAAVDVGAGENRDDTVGGAGRSKDTRSADMLTSRSLSAAVAVLITLAVVGPVAAQEFSPAVVFDMGGKFDKSFNEAAYAGAERFKKETGIAYREFEVTSEAQREQALRNMARRGSAIVVGVGFSQASGMEKVAKEFPNLKFAIVDAVVDLPNVQSIVFKEHEGSFLVGMAAAMASKTGKVGFVGGMDIPLIRRRTRPYRSS